MREDYTISEIAKMFNITTNKIRFYEKKGLLLPIRQNDNKYRKFNEVEELDRKNPKILEIRDEYYSYIDLLKNEFRKYNKELEYSRIYKFNYIVKIR